MNGRDARYTPAHPQRGFDVVRDTTDATNLYGRLPLTARWREAQSGSSISVQDLVTSARTPDSPSESRSSGDISKP